MSRHDTIVNSLEKRSLAMPRELWTCTVERNERVVSLYRKLTETKDTLATTISPCCRTSKCATPHLSEAARDALSGMNDQTNRDQVLMIRDLQSTSFSLVSCLFLCVRRFRYLTNRHLEQELFPVRQTSEPLHRGRSGFVPRSGNYSSMSIPF